MEANIKNTFIKVFETLIVLNENCIEICKSQIMEWHQMFIKNYKSDNEQMNLMIHLATKIIRLLYQENLNVSNFFKGIFYHKNLMISKEINYFIRELQNLFPFNFEFNNLDDR